MVLGVSYLRVLAQRPTGCCSASLYYKRRDPYICSAKAPVLEGSGSRRMYPLKGTSVDRVYVVFGARVDLGFFTIRQNGFMMGVRSLKVTARYWLLV